ncbi:hypothetical protein, partial [Paralimibaculum aggregatum]|uniref:hypothetical protein n=1 Tax=Paralimibaculum aggregatum TaxID=3036245 RepID=UPI00255598B6
QEPEVRRAGIGMLRPRLPGQGLDRVSELAAAPIGESDPVHRAGPGGFRPAASFGLAQVNRNPDSFDSPGLPQFGGDPSGLDSRIARAPAPSMAFEESGRIALVTPESGLGNVRSLGSGALVIVPAATRAAPSPIAPRSEEDTALTLPGGVRFDPDAPAVDPETGLPATVAPEEGPAFAGLTPASDECTVPPMLNIHPKPSAVTTVTVDAPCYVGDIVVLELQGIAFAARVGDDHKALIDVPGFTSSMPATLRFPDGKSQNLDIQFSDTNRIVRVALAWDSPVTLELHAIRSGQSFWSDDHLRPENPGSQGEARRHAGGYLMQHDPVDGVGSAVRIYTHYVRGSTAPEVINLLVDFTSRRRIGATETCGNGRWAAPVYRVIRSTRGVMARERRGLIGALACDEVKDYGNRLDDTVVRDIVLSSR